MPRGVCGRRKASGGVTGSAPGGGGPGGVPGKNASGGVGGGGPSGVLGDKGGVEGNGETRTPLGHRPQSSGGVIGTISLTSSTSSYLRRERLHVRKDCFKQAVLRKVLSKRLWLSVYVHVIKPEIGLSEKQATSRRVPHEHVSDKRLRIIGFHVHGVRPGMG